MKLFNVFGKAANASKLKATVEAGKSSTVIYDGTIISKDRNADMRGERKYRFFNEMASNLSVVSASVRLVTTLAGSASWQVQPHDSEDAQAVKYAELLPAILDSGEFSFDSIIRQAAMYQFNGFAWLEITAKKMSDGTFGLKSIESRPCVSISRWDVDDSGTVLGVWQKLPKTMEEVYIPRWKSLYLCDNLMSDSPDGIGLFRTIAESCARLIAIQISEKISIDRDLRGIPIAKAPISALEADGASPEQIEQILEPIKSFVSMVQKGEATGYVLDSATYESRSETSSGSSLSSTGNAQYGIELLSAASSGLGDVDNVIRRLNTEIARALGTDSMLVGESGSGSLALSSDKSRNLLLSINSQLKYIFDVINRDLVSFIGTINGWDMDKLPRLVPSEVSQRSMEDIVSALRELATSGVTLTRTDEAVKEIFRSLDLTPLEPIENEEVF